MDHKYVQYTTAKANVSFYKSALLKELVYFNGRIFWQGIPILEERNKTWQDICHVNFD